MLAINDSNFEELVVNSQVPVLLDFWATWCHSKVQCGRGIRCPHEVRYTQYPYTAFLQGR